MLLLCRQGRPDPAKKGDSRHAAGRHPETMKMVSAPSTHNPSPRSPIAVSANHVHLLAVPQQCTSLALGIGKPHMRYSRRINAERGWTDHFGTDPFFSSVLDEEHLWHTIRSSTCARGAGAPMRGVAVVKCQSALRNARTWRRAVEQRRPIPQQRLRRNTLTGRATRRTNRPTTGSSDLVSLMSLWSLASFPRTV